MAKITSYRDSVVRDVPLGKNEITWKSGGSEYMLLLLQLCLVIIASYSGLLFIR